MVLSLPIGGSQVALGGPGSGWVSVKPVRHGAGPLARALHAPMFDSATTERHGRPDIARYIFSEPGSIRHDGAKRLQHPEVGLLALTYQSLDLPMSHRAVHDLTLYTAEPGTTSEERLKLLAGLAATPSRATRHTHRLR
ncbi:MmyB family transcriptional regulator [Actinoallomurus rhizosphaericola]|uniref:MmyB family transcriptional regulator n=1 Tax=Actinoallomurus rhizosphaericola TaxID=2952536 RepID=UPI00209264F7|nr:hypothetical protein [Actinoallomurus rhizosphaericola]MCO5995662.1 hypothetical protein [Actinoallomurus rhizosphaericola]